MSITKRSAAAKEREKERKILDYGTHLLNIIWACRDKSYYKDQTWERKQMHEYEGQWHAFVIGCRLAGGFKWYHKLNNLYADYQALHGSIYEPRRK